MAPSRPSATTAGGCTRTPTSRACGSCTVRWQHGHSIGRLAGLTNEELRHLRRAGRERGAVAGRSARRTPLDTAALTAALQPATTRQPSIRDLRLAAVLRPLELLRDVLMPMLAQVGDDWHRQRARIAQEHLMSSTMRNILGSFLRLYARPRRPARLLFATPPASATRSRRSARRCWRPAAGWASPISAPIFPPATSSTA